MFEFKILSKQKKTLARVGEFKTPHGKLITPELAFVATEGEIKSIPKEILPELPVNLIIVNTFHLWVKKIIQTIDGRKWKVDLENKNQPSSFQPQNLSSSFYSPSSNIKTIHNYSNFSRSIMSDSGGFQVFSLGFGKSHGVGKVASMFPDSTDSTDYNNPLIITDEGVIFTFNDKKLTLTPELSMKLQQKIGADIIFAFDECTSPLNSYEYTKKAMERTHEWLNRCIKTKKTIDDRRFKVDLEARKLKIEKKNQTSTFQLQNPSSSFYPLPSNFQQALFPIIQGGHYEDLRKISAKFVAKQDVPGFGIGGSLGRNKQDVWNILKWVIPFLPEEKPRHLLGIGQVRDIFEAIEQGVDLFDCVIPTREARHKVLYTKKSRLNLRSLKNSNEVIEKDCKCHACRQQLTYRQLIQLFQLHDPRAYFFATVHNIQFYSDLMTQIREAIELKKFNKLKEEILKYY